MAQPWTDPDDDTERGNVYFNIVSTCILTCTAVLMLMQVVGSMYPGLMPKGIRLPQGGWVVVALAFASFIFAWASTTYVERSLPYVRYSPQLSMLLIMSGALTAISFAAMTSWTALNYFFT